MIDQYFFLVIHEYQKTLSQIPTLILRSLIEALHTANISWKIKVITILEPTDWSTTEDCRMFYSNSFYNIDSPTAFPSMNYTWSNCLQKLMKSVLQVRSSTPVTVFATMMYDWCHIMPRKNSLGSSINHPLFEV